MTIIAIYDLGRTFYLFASIDPWQSDKVVVPGLDDPIYSWEPISTVEARRYCE